MPDLETIDAVQDLIPEVMAAKAHLPVGRAGIILVASIPPLKITTTRDGEEVVLRGLQFPRWVYRTVVDPGGQQDPIPAAGQEIDRVRYYLALAAGHRIPIGAYFYTRTSHAPVYRGWVDTLSLFLNPFDLERLTDEQVYAIIRGWYDRAGAWLAVVPRQSVLDVAIVTGMRGFFAADRRDGFLSAYASLESLAKARATGRGWCDPLPLKSPWLTGWRLDRAIEELLKKWAKEQAGSARTWRKARTRMIHPITGPPLEQEVWNLIRSVTSAGRAVLAGVLTEISESQKKP